MVPSRFEGRQLGSKLGVPFVKLGFLRIDGVDLVHQSFGFFGQFNHISFSLGQLGFFGFALGLGRSGFLLSFLEPKDMVSLEGLLQFFVFLQGSFQRFQPTTTFVDYRIDDVDVVLYLGDHSRRPGTTFHPNVQVE